MPQQVAYPIGDRLYLNITDRCTLGCRFCPKNNGSYRVHAFDLRLEHRPAEEEILEAVGDPARYSEVVFCGFGEPTLRLKVLLRVAAGIRAQGGRVRVNTDGLSDLVNKRDTLPELGACVDALSVSLNAQDPDTYERHCVPALPGAYPALLSFLERAPRHVPEVTATAIDGLDGVDIAACRRLAEGLGVGFRRRVLDRVG